MPRSGVPGIQGFPTIPMEERLWAKINKKGKDECWEWHGPKIYSGYGVFYFEGKNRLAHRFIYEFMNGIRLGKMHALHKCDNRSCVNPDHIYAGTHQDNMRDRDSRGRGHAAKITHCKRGHPLFGENLSININGQRVCKECRRMRDKCRYHNNNGIEKARKKRELRRMRNGLQINE